jgi:hypothetical protein
MPPGAPMASEISISRVIAAMPASVAAIFKRLMREPRLSREEMRRRVTTYLVGIESLARQVDYIDVELVQSIANRCCRLIDGVDVRSSEEHRRLVQAAVLYFLVDEDAESDTSSLIGFDDDRLVVDAVWEEVTAGAGAD